MKLVEFIASVADFVALSQTCRLLSNVLRHSRLIRSLLDQNLAQQLARFNLRLHDLQNLFSLHKGAVLSGSTVLQSYTGDRWLDSDIDIYIPYKEDIETLLVKLFPPVLRSEEDNAEIDNNLDINDNHTDNGFSSDIVIHIEKLSSKRKTAVQSVLQLFGLPPDQYAKATVVYSEYAPDHVKFMLELVQKTLQKRILPLSGTVSYDKKAIQLIFVDMEKYPQFTDCGSVVNFFDLSIVQNYYDGSRFHSNYIQHVLFKEMSLTTSYNGIQCIQPNVMCRLTKYMLNRQFRFLGPYLPLSSIAREVYEGEISRFGGPAWITEQPVPPTKEIINGDWIFAEAEADPYFYDSDRHGYETYRVHWRSLRYNAMIERLEGRPNYGNEEWLKLLMPEQYKVHRCIIAPTLLQSSSSGILQSTKESVATNNNSKSRPNSSTMPNTKNHDNAHRSAVNDTFHAAKSHHLREHPMRHQLLQILKFRAAHNQPTEEGTYYKVNGGESSSSANHNSHNNNLPGSEEIDAVKEDDDIIVPDEIQNDNNITYAG